MARIDEIHNEDAHYTMLFASVYHKAMGILQREELRSSLQQVTVELDRANQALSEFNETRHELQARKDEIIRLKSQMEEEKMKRFLR